MARTCRSPWSVVIALVALGGLLAAVGLALSLFEDPVLFAWPLVVAFGVPSLWVLVRAPVVGTKLSGSDLVYRGFFRSRRAALARISSVESTPGEEKLLWMTWNPTLTLDDGSTIECMTLAGYSMSDERSNRRVARQVSVMQGWRSSRGEEV